MPSLCNLLLKAGVLPEGLDEGADGVLHRQAHLVLQLGETIGLEALYHPIVVGLEIELRLPHQEGIGAEAIEGFEPTLGGFELAFEGLDVGRTGGDKTPTEYSRLFSRVFLRVPLRSDAPSGTRIPGTPATRRADYATASCLRGHGFVRNSSLIFRYDNITLDLGGHSRDTPTPWGKKGVVL